MEVQGSHREWCALVSGNESAIGPDCHNFPRFIIRAYSIDQLNTSRKTNNSSCSFPICVEALYYTIENTKIRVYDLVLLSLTAVFLLYLLFRLVPTLRKLHGSLPLFKILYVMVFLIVVLNSIHGVVSMTLGYYSQSAKIFHVLLRGSILMAELSVVIFGLFFKYYNNKLYKLIITVIVLVVVAVLFTVAEGLMEFLMKHDYACNDFRFFAHGGLLFLFVTSTLFAIAYFITFMLYLFNLHVRWDLPSKKSFYRYALFLAMVNVLQAAGSMLWYTGKHHPDSGHVGICLTAVTTLIYLTTFAPMVYWIFLSNYFRMNKPLQNVDGQINVSTEDTSLRSRHPSLRIGVPIPAVKRSYIEEQTALFGSSVSDSVSSYGSFIQDEEEFSKTES